ncbi:unnamed protein product, partial [Amoebophrya sp. A25]
IPVHTRRWVGSTAALVRRGLCRKMTAGGSDDHAGSTVECITAGADSSTPRGPEVVEAGPGGAEESSPEERQRNGEDVGKVSKIDENFSNPPSKGVHQDGETSMGEEISSRLAAGNGMKAATLLDVGVKADEETSAGAVEASSGLEQENAVKVNAEARPTSPRPRPPAVLASNNAATTAGAAPTGTGEGNKQLNQEVSDATARELEDADLQRIQTQVEQLGVAAMEDDAVLFGPQVTAPRSTVLEKEILT